MKAIIIAAGMGTRLGDITKDKPKCLIEFDGKPLLQIQIDIFRALGITDISVIVGYKKETITADGVKYYVNEDYENNNILESLFYAAEELNDSVLVSYSDIVFEKEVVAAALQAKDDIALVSDVRWQDVYVGREHHPLSEAENVVFDESYRATSIGKGLSHQQDGTLAEFIGMLTLSKRGCEQLKQTYSACKERCWGQPFQKAATFQRAYITDIMQELIDNNIRVTCTPIEGGWREIDTLEDYEKARQVVRKMVI